jgi:hypothetical protein
LAPPSHEQGTREGHEHDAAFPSSNRTGPFFFSLTFFSQLDPSVGRSTKEYDDVNTNWWGTDDEGDV